MFAPDECGESSEIILQKLEGVGNAAGGYTEAVNESSETL